MSVTVVVGGQFGSEGKGKVAHLFCRMQSAKVAVRVGGPNSGHTVQEPSGRKWIFQQLPTAAILPGVCCVIPAGAYIDVPLLLQEIKDAGLANGRLLIDPNATVLSEQDRTTETNWGLKSSIGSTGSGTGSAVIARILRNNEHLLAKHDSRLLSFICDTRPFMRKHIQQGNKIVVEGTQGFGLSLLHAEDYPYVTSRDTTAAACIAEAGLSPLDVEDVVLVIRAFPIRVAGNSGPLPNETTWDGVTRQSGSNTEISERTSVTKKIRRVASFDPTVVRAAIITNAPTQIVLNHVDYVDATCQQQNELTPRASQFVTDVERQIDATINFVGFHPSSLKEHKSAKVLNLV